MLTLNQLTRDYPEETANRMMMARGSALLLRALKGEPEPKPIPTWKERIVGGKNYVPVSERPKFGAPRAVRELIEAVEEAFELDPGAICGKVRDTRHILARSLLIRLVRDRKWVNGEHKHSTTTIGRYLDRDHSTICNALTKFDIYCTQFPEVAELYEKLSPCVETEESVAA